MAAPRIVIDDLFEYNPMDFAGTGGNAIVYRGFRIKDKAEVAVKVMTKDNTKGDLAKSVMRELLPQKFSHNNVIAILYYTPKEYSRMTMHGIIKTTQHFIIMELCQSDLLNYFHGEKPIPDDRIDLLHQCAKGLLCLHENRLMHRDLKPANVLIKMIHDNAIVKLADYGHSRLTPDKDSRLTSSNVGTVSWRAPEQFRHSTDYGQSVDVFSMGLIFLAVMTCDPAHCENCNDLSLFEGNYLFL
jgi:serine/threonine protein kinase